MFFKERAAIEGSGKLLRGWLRAIAVLVGVVPLMVTGLIVEGLRGGGLIELEDEDCGTMGCDLNKELTSSPCRFGVQPICFNTCATRLRSSSML